MAGGGDAGRTLTGLTAFERTAFRLVRRMNLGRFKRLWSWCGRNIGARWIYALVSNRLEVHGLDHVHGARRERPLLVVANHRSFFDMYVVMAILYRRSSGWREIYFPVRGRFFYQSPLGLVVNFLAAWWAMFPPFFNSRDKRRFDQYAFGILEDLCREGSARVVGFHPEGTRNRNPDPHSLLPVQPGIGRLVLEARPQLVPVFVAGLSNSLVAEITARVKGGSPIRVRFGAVRDYDALEAGGASARSVAEEVMSQIRALAQQDRDLLGCSTDSSPT